MDRQTAWEPAEAIHGYATLGLYEEAMEAVDEVPDTGNKTDLIWGTRVALLTLMRNWEEGARAATRIRKDDCLAVRYCAGLFHLQHAERLCAAGNLNAAKDAVWKLVAIWPEGRMQALQSEALAPIW